MNCLFNWKFHSGSAKNFMANGSWTLQDYLVPIKAYIEADIRHWRRDWAIFLGYSKEAFNNHLDCRLMRWILDTRSTYVTFTRACQRYKSVINTVKEEDLFQLTRATHDSCYLWKCRTNFVGHASYDLRISYIRQFEWSFMYLSLNSMYLISIERIRIQFHVFSFSSMYVL